jgi:hypothetical protein
MNKNIGAIIGCWIFHNKVNVRHNHEKGTPK